MSSFLKTKKLKSLSKKCLVLREEVEDIADLSYFYNSDLQEFFKKHAEALGIESPKEVVPDQRPPKRKIGTRPEKMSRLKKNKIVKSHNSKGYDTKEVKDYKGYVGEWQRKLFKKIMMQTHPDRVDSVAKTEREKFERLNYNQIVLDGCEDAMLLAIGSQLNLLVDVSFEKQFQLLKIYELGIQKKISNIQKSFGYMWGEFNHDIGAKLQIIKELLKINGLNIPSDGIIISLFGKK